MDSWVGAAVWGPDHGSPAEPNWFVMAAGMLIGAAVLYGLYRLGPKRQVGSTAPNLLVAALLSAAGSLVFLVVGIVTAVNGAT